MIHSDVLFETPRSVAPDTLVGVMADGGWYADALPDLWSAGCRAALLFGDRTIPPGQPMLLTLRVFSPAATRLTITSEGQAPVICTDITNEIMVVQVLAPVTESHRTGRMAFEVDRSDSPFSLGYSTDERRLGVQLIDILPLPDLPFLFDWADPALGAVVLSQGWHAPESDGCWSRGGIARIWLPTSLVPARSRLRLDLVPGPTGDGPAVVVDARVAGRPAGRWDFSTEKADTIIEVAPEDAGRNGMIDIELDIAHATSPLALGLSVDPRELGVKLRGISAADAN